MYQVVDLFAGAGGLSLGFKQTRKYDVKVAFENNPAMQETYKRNHPGVDVRGDVCTADYKQIKEQYGDVDVVIGGPPCQGFSNANRQKNHAICQNNMLVKQYIRAIKELQPKAFVLENVSMLKSDVHRFYLNQDDIERELLKKYGIKTKETPLELIGEESFFRQAEEIVKKKSLVKEYLWPYEHYALLNIIFKASKNNKKLLKALDKHKKQLLEYADLYISEKCTDHILEQNKKAFLGIKDYFGGIISANQNNETIRDAVNIQRM